MMNWKIALGSSLSCGFFANLVHINSVNSIIWVEMAMDFLMTSVFVGGAYCMGLYFEGRKTQIEISKLRRHTIINSLDKIDFRLKKMEESLPRKQPFPGKESNEKLQTGVEK